MMSIEELEGLRRSTVSAGISKKQILDLISSNVQALELVEQQQNGSKPADTASEETEDLPDLETEGEVAF